MTAGKLASAGWIWPRPLAACRCDPKPYGEIRFPSEGALNREHKAIYMQLGDFDPAAKLEAVAALVKGHGHAADVDASRPGHADLRLDAGA